MLKIFSLLSSSVVQLDRKGYDFCFKLHQELFTYNYQVSIYSNTEDIHIALLGCIV